MRRRKGLSFYQKKKKISASVMREIWNVIRSEEHTSELQSHSDLVCRLLLEKT